MIHLPLVPRLTAPENLKAKALKLAPEQQRCASHKKGADAPEVPRENSSPVCYAQAAGLREGF